jgi:hypothetical protein
MYPIRQKPKRANSGGRAFLPVVFGHTLIAPRLRLGMHCPRDSASPVTAGRHSYAHRREKVLPRKKVWNTTC